VQCDNNNREMIENPPTKTGSDWLSEGLLSASGRGHAVLS